MGALVILGFVGLCLVSNGISSTSLEDSPSKDSSPWGSFGSRSAAGFSLRFPWHVASSRVESPLRPVNVQCQEANMVVAVQRDLFGTGKLIQPADLRLGAASCKYTSFNDNSVTFQTELQDCGNTLQLTLDLLVYSSILTYNPTPSGSRVITRTNQASVLIQCTYPRNHNVTSKAINPTWIPFSSTVYSEERLALSLRLMNDDWRSARTSTTFQLGDVFNIEASLQTGSHVAMMIFVDRCVATLNPDQGSRPRYDLIAYNGCLVDGKLSDSSSAFKYPRYQLDKLQFTVDAFRFIGDSHSLIYITCNLKAVAASQTPDPMNKACSYSKASNGWSPVEGSSDICSCCDAGNCGAPFSGKRKRSVLPGPGEVLAVQSAVLGPLEVLHAHKSNVLEEVEMRSLHGPAAEAWMVLWLALVAIALLSLLTMGAVVLYRRFRSFHSDL